MAIWKERGEMVNLETKRFLGTEDVSDILGVTQRTVLYLIKSGELKAERINRRPWVIVREDLEAYQATKNRDEATDEPLDEAA
jgi:excisionase family DNA binding protein